MTRAVAAAVLCLATLPVFAQYKDCKPAALPGTYHLFIDDIRFTDEDSVPGDMKLVREVLYGSVQNQLQAMRLHNLPLRTNRCSGRFPQASDFTKQRVESLNNRDVVMEVWTEIRPSEENRFDAELNVILVPAMLLSLSGQSTPPFFSAAYPLTQNQRKEQQLELLRAYALIGAGLRAVENKDYSVANAFLCRGMAELRHAPRTREHQKLLAYVDAASTRVIADARRRAAVREGRSQGERSQPDREGVFAAHADENPSFDSELRECGQDPAAPQGPERARSQPRPDLARDSRPRRTER